MDSFDQRGGFTGELGIRGADASDDDRCFQAFTARVKVTAFSLGTLQVPLYGRK